MLRQLDGPDRVFSTASEAAAWLGLTESEFRAEAEAFPDLLPHEGVGGGKKWHWIDIARYAIRRPGRGSLPPREERRRRKKQGGDDGPSAES